jgi:GR25 family glycosyltransferase involved in LPS biosynthesis
MKLRDYDAVVMNLDTRPERWEAVQQEIPKIGITVFQRFSALPGGNAGFSASHLACVTGHGLRFVFEDDVYFESGALDVFNKAIEQLPDNFDMFYLGANVKTPAARYSENLYQVTGGVHTTHAILFSDHARQFIIENYDPAEHNIIDEWYYRKGLSSMQCFVCSPMIAFQRGGYSDLRLQYFDYRTEMLENAKNNMI